MVKGWIEVAEGGDAARCPFCGRVVKWLSDELGNSPYYYYRGKVIDKCEHFVAVRKAIGKTGIAFTFSEER